MVTHWRRKVAREAHSFTGLLRFMELRDRTLYAAYEPDHNITLLLTPHFRVRLPREQWVIHDRKRGLTVAWNQGGLHQVAGVPADIPSLLHQEELAYQRLWRTLTRSLAVPERTNPVLQRRCMPRRY